MMINDDGFIVLSAYGMDGNPCGKGFPLTVSLPPALDGGRT
jgi:hypothetical protein